MTYIKWPPLIARAKELVEGFEARFGRPPTLRRLHYLMISDPVTKRLGYVNTDSRYTYLSNLTAAGRREGTFPDFSEEGREVLRPRYFDDADDVRDYIRRTVRTDRMKGQEHSICLAIEKIGSRQFLIDWFWDYGVHITAVEGYASQTQIDFIRDWQADDGRPMDVLYSGDLDASGEDISRVFKARLLHGYPDDNTRFIFHRVGLLREHIDAYGLVMDSSAKKDSRAADFIRRHGIQFQVELDALDPAILRTLYQEEFDKHWDNEIYEEQKSLEADMIKEVLGED